MDAKPLPAAAMAPRRGTMVRIGQLELTFLVDETTPPGDMVMFEFVTPPHAKVPAPHYHEAVDEVVYGLSGVLDVTVGGVAHRLGAGEVVFIPRGVVHHHANTGSEDARTLVVLTPASIGRRYFEEMAEVINVAGPPDLAKAKAVMLRHGLIPV
jgi:quercetin dioxygenase-like cupin family protein